MVLMLALVLMVAIMMIVVLGMVVGNLWWVRQDGGVPTNQPTNVPVAYTSIC